MVRYQVAKQRILNLSNLIVLVFAVLLSQSLNAQDLGSQGSVYPIQEQDALQWIDQRLQVLEARGEIARAQRILTENTLLHLERPIPVKGLKPTEASRIFEKDLTITLTSDIRDANGRIIHPQGTKVNPLSQNFCPKRLIFLDGDCPKQLDFALKQYQEKPTLTKLVLINGPVLALMRELEIPFYFDQAGRLVEYFEIKQIPALVSQVKDKLSIREIKL